MKHRCGAPAAHSTEEVQSHIHYLHPSFPWSPPYVFNLAPLAYHTIKKRSHFSVFNLALLTFLSYQLCFHEFG